MISVAAPPLVDPARIAALQRALLLDTPPEEQFDRLVRLTSTTLHTPTVLISLVDAEREFFKSSTGLPEPWQSRREAPLSHSFCQHVVTSGKPLIIQDARQHPWVQSNPAITELAIVAYVGMPLRSTDGYVLGAFCAAYPAPHAWEASEIRMLKEFTAAAIREIDARIAIRHAEGQRGADTKAADTLLFGTPQFHTLIEHPLVGIYLAQDGRFLHVDPKFAQIFGYTQEEIVSTTGVLDLVGDEDRAWVEQNREKRLRGPAGSLHQGFRGKRKDGSRVDIEMHGTRTEVGGKPAVIGTMLAVTEREQAEAALRRKEREFHLLIENAWDIIHVLNADGTIRYMSPSVQRMLGYTPQEMIGRNSADFVHPEDVPKTAQAFDEEIQHPGGQRFLEIRLRHKNGSWRTVEVVGQFTTDASGQPIGIVNTHDITERKQAEEALRRSEERYELVARATSDVIWDWDIATGKLVWNEAMQRAFRYRPEQVEGTIEWWSNQIHPEDRERVVTGLHGILDGVGDVWSDEYRFQRGNGSYATVLDRGYVVRNERGEPIRAIGSMVDITERKREEEAQRFLAQASTLLDTSLEQEVTLASLARLAVPTLADYCLIDLVEESGAIRRVATAHADPGKEEILVKDECHPPDADPERHPVVQVVRTGKPLLVREFADPVFQEIQHDAEHRERLRTLGLRSFMIVPFIARERVLGAMTLAMAESGRSYDPVDLMRAEDLARRAALAIDNASLYEKAQRAIEAREEVLAVVSHDLRNPLHTITLGASALLEESTERGASHTKYLESIQRAAEQANVMIKDLLDVSGIESGHFAVAPSRQSVTDLLKQVRDLFLPIVTETSIGLECEVANDVGTVWADPDQLHRVFSNLVGNAIKFTPADGMITLRAWRAGEEVNFSVADTGPGIPPEQLPYLFDRYWQAKHGDRRGAGLGLSIAKGIVEAHGGRIWVESTPGTGATFYFSLPIAGGE